MEKSFTNLKVVPMPALIQEKPIWLAAYTLPRAEKKAFEKLEQMKVHAYLPLCEKLRIWSDRKKKIWEPLFPNYIFIRTTFSKRFEPLQLRELIRYVSFGGSLAKIEEEEIECIKKLTNSDHDISISNERYSQKGMPVRIVKGQMAGLKGVLDYQQGKERLLIQVTSLRQNISLNVTADMIVPDN